MASLLALVLLLAPGGALARGDPALVRRAFARRARTGPAVTEILFVGNESFEDDSLLPYMETRESGFFRTTGYDRRAFLRDLENLQRFYVSQGFLDADVGLDDMMLSADSTSVRLLIGVYEGDRWMAEDVSFEGASVIPEKKLRGVVTVGEGTPFVIGELDSDRRAVLEEYARRSYLDARVAQDVVSDEDSRSATITYRITEREQARIASIDVIGNEKTRQYVVERQVRLDRVGSGGYGQGGEAREGTRGRAVERSHRLQLRLRGHRRCRSGCRDLQPERAGAGDGSGSHGEVQRARSGGKGVDGQPVVPGATGVR